MKIEWTPEEISTLRDMWENEEASVIIGEALGRSRDAITSKARHLRLRKRANPAMTHANILAEHLANGLNVDAAGKAMGLSFSKSKMIFEHICASMGPQALGTWRINWPRDGAN